MTEQRYVVIDLIDAKRMNHEKVIVKELLKDSCKVGLYSFYNEATLNEDRLLEENVDAIISTSSIQIGQFIEEIILSIFVPKCISTVCSVN